jgi:hypothetical protein
MAAVATIGSETAAADVETESADMTRIIGDTGRTYRLVSGVLRNTTGKWYWISDAGHRPTGFKAVTQTTSFITLPYTFTGTRVSSFQVTPDDYFASTGLRVGASVGLSSTALFLYTTNPYLGKPSVAANPAGVKAATGNLWVTGLIEI